METYIQITNDAAAKTILRGDISELYIKQGRSIVPCDNTTTSLRQLEKGRFYVQLTANNEEMSE
ncbi:hypothetical protein O5A27_000945 [Listeria monocytogenes]|nr:hypothetical protein [Listeria monocytogenes]EKG8152341.1 hypothetical protein [Listeria monocytogenes]HAO6048830.1 hypothetical protein [Listeria monocytogenes]HAO6597321.1 hypothetical protein [Listeria monocytogenes]